MGDWVGDSDGGLGHSGSQGRNGRLGGELGRRPGSLRESREEWVIGWGTTTTALGTQGVKGGMGDWVGDSDGGLGHSLRESGEELAIGWGTSKTEAWRGTQMRLR